MARTILIIDDDRERCDLVGELLRGEGFDVLPEQNGFEILRALRQRSGVPVIHTRRPSPLAWRRDCEDSVAAIHRT